MRRSETLLYYQIGSKHRDDHARNGLLRMKEFTMKDAYSLHVTAESLDESYRTMRGAYARLFDSLGLEFVVTTAANSVMGGSDSEEFVAPVETGTLDLVYCGADCRFGATEESPTQYAADEACPECGADLVAGEGIEIGHVFKLGTRYSEAMDLTVDLADGGETEVLMGSYGIGVERLIHTLLAQHSDDAGCRWVGERSVAPYQAAIVPLDYSGDVAAVADRLHDEIGREETLLFDDAEQTIGERFAESDLLGISRKIVLGNHYEETGEVELESRDGETRYVDAERVAEVIENTR
jgi:prolyl-tRNA synthetase